MLKRVQQDKMKTYNQQILQHWQGELFILGPAWVRRLKREIWLASQTWRALETKIWWRHYIIPLYRDAITLCDATMSFCLVIMWFCRVIIYACLFHILKYVISYAIYYMASITSGEMADCDWLRSIFSGPLIIIIIIFNFPPYDFICGSQRILPRVARPLLFINFSVIVCYIC